MRKIISRETRDKKSKKNQLIVGIFLIGIMIFGTLGFAFGGRNEENSKKIEYNGIEFIQDNSGFWNFNIQGYNFITKYNPTEVNDILFFNSLAINDYGNKPLYFVSKFNEPNYEISRNLNQFVLRMQNACLNEKDCEESLPIKNCSIDNVIIIKEPKDEIKEIRQEENCVYIITNFEEQTKYADVFLFKILGL